MDFGARRRPHNYLNLFRCTLLREADHPAVVMTLLIWPLLSLGRSKSELTPSDGGWWWMPGRARQSWPWKPRNWARLPFKLQPPRVYLSSSHYVLHITGRLLATAARPANVRSKRDQEQKYEIISKAQGWEYVNFERRRCNAPSPTVILQVGSTSLSWAISTQKNDRVPTCITLESDDEQHGSMVESYELDIRLDVRTYKHPHIDILTSLTREQRLLQRLAVVNRNSLSVPALAMARCGKSSPVPVVLWANQATVSV